MRGALRRALLVIALLLALASCGLNKDESDAADSIAAVLGGDQASQSTKDSADCVAGKWVGQVGTAPLVADGVLTKDLKARKPFLAAVERGTRTVSEKVADAYAAAWIACADFDAIALDRKSGTHASAEQLDEYADCLKGVDDDEWRQALADTWTGLTESSATVGLKRDLAGCEKQLGG
jgi:predicted small lipoprotein YifL